MHKVEERNSHGIQVLMEQIQKHLEAQTILQKETLTFQEALSYLSVSSSFLYKLTHKRAIVFYKPGLKLIYFKRTDLDQWMLNNRQPSSQELSQLPNPKTNKTKRF